MQAGFGRRHGLEPLCADRGADDHLALWMEDLEGDRAAASIVGQEDPRSSATPDLPVHGIPVLEGVPDDREQVAADWYPRLQE